MITKEYIKDIIKQSDTDIVYSDYIVNSLFEKGEFNVKTGLKSFKDFCQADTISYLEKIGIISAYWFFAKYKLNNFFERNQQLKNREEKLKKILENL